MGGEEGFEPTGDGSIEDDTTATPFRTVSKAEVTTQERLAALYREFVYAPAKIIWHDNRARIGLAIVVFYGFVGFLGPVVMEPTGVRDGPRLQAPFESWDHPLGTDPQGVDLLTQTVFSTTPILQMVIAGAAFSVITGTTVGIVAGYKGGMIDTVLSTITDVFINIPGLPLVIVLAAMLDPRNPYIVGIILSVAAWAGLARNVRSQVLSLRTAAYIEAARTMGVSTSLIVFRHTLPQLMPYVSINAVNHGRNVIYAAVGLYFIGVLPMAHDNWGVMLQRAYAAGGLYASDRTHWMIIPMVAIVMLSLGMILLAQSFDRVFNPRVRSRHMGEEEGPVQ